MPARNKKVVKERQRLTTKTVAPEQIVVGAQPSPFAPGLIVKKTLQDALIDGLEDPVAFAHDFLDVEPYEAQQVFLRSTRDVTEANFVAGNRCGKTWLAGLILLWRAFYRFIPPATAPERPSPHVTYKAVSTSLTHDQAKLAWTYALTFSESKRFKPFVLDVVHSPFPTMKLRVRNEKGDWVVSEVWARSLAKGGVYLLGHSISFILVDECAYIQGYPKIEDEVLRMRLADQGGALFRISTPNGRNHFFTYYQEGLKGDPLIYSQRISTWENPTVSHTVLERMKERMVPEFYAQNVMAEFVSLSDFFKLEHIEALYRDVEYTDKAGNPLAVQLPVEPERDATYVMGVDLGAMRDPTVCIVWRIDTNPVQTVYVGESRNPNWQTQRQFANRVYQTYQPVRSFVDATGVGNPIAQQLTDEDGWINTEKFVIGPANKPDLLVRLQDAVQRRKFVFPYVQVTKELVNQMSFYRLDDKDISQDYVLALALVNMAYEDHTKRNQMETKVYEDLAFIDVLRGGQTIGGTDVTGPGTLFTLDPTTGMYLPVGYVEGDEDGFILG